MQDKASTFDIPDRIEGLDRDWFERALRRRFPEVRLDDARIVDVNHGTCTKIRVALAYAPIADAGLPATMLVKGGFAEHSPRFLEMHATEMRYYRDIAPRAPFATPACYFEGIDPADGRSLVVLEDLDARSVRWLGALAPLAWPAQLAFTDALAAFAAKWWESPELAPGGPLDWVIHSYEREAAAYIAWYLEPERWNGFMALPRCACLPRRLHDRERMAAALSALEQRLPAQPVTLSHGDTHLGNLYLDRDGAAGFLDAQPRRAPWVKDFAYQLVAALDVEDRRRWERPLLARYLRRLAEAEVAQVPSFDEAWHDYRCEIPYGLFIFMINEGHFQREETNTAFAARFGAAAIDHAGFELLT